MSSMCKKCLAVFVMFILVAAAAFFIVLKSDAQTPSIVINEIAWMGTENNYADEWIELYNVSDNIITLDGWELRSTDGKPIINLAGNIHVNGFFLLERTDDTSVQNVQADLIYTGDLGNSGEHLELVDSERNIIDNVNAWGGWENFAGDNDTKQTMERKNPNLPPSDPASWGTSQNPGGTPKAKNSVYKQANQKTEQQTTGDDSAIQSDEPRTNNDSQQTGENQTNNEEPAVIHGAEKPESQTAESENGSGKNKKMLTVETATTSATTTESQGQSITYPKNIYINELMPSPAGNDSTDEWVEIVNKNNETVDLSGWSIQDTAGITNVYTFPNGSLFGAKTFLVLSRPTTNITLNNDADGVELLNPNIEVSHSAAYLKAETGKSYSANEDSWQWTDVPTPGSANILSKKETPPPAQTPNKAGASSKKNTKSSEAAYMDNPPLTSSLSASRTTQTASVADSIQNSIGEDSGNSNIMVSIIALCVALASGAMVFIIKKRGSGPIP